MSGKQTVLFTITNRKDQFCMTDIFFKNMKSETPAICKLWKIFQMQTSWANREYLFLTLPGWVTGMFWQINVKTGVLKWSRETEIHPWVIHFKHEIHLEAVIDIRNKFTRQETVFHCLWNQWKIWCSLLSFLTQWIHDDVTRTVTHKSL